MKHSTSQKEIVLRELRHNGSVSRNKCVSGAYGEIITRLSSYILKFRAEGMHIDTAETTNPKETMYYLTDKPKEIIEYRVEGKLVGTKKIW